MDDDGEEGPKQGMFCLQRFPEEIFGDDDAASKLYPVTELDPHKVRTIWDGMVQIRDGLVRKMGAFPDGSARGVWDLELTGT